MIQHACLSEFTLQQCRDHQTYHTAPQKLGVVVVIDCGIENYKSFSSAAFKSKKGARSPGITRSVPHQITAITITDKLMALVMGHAQKHFLLGCHCLEFEFKTPEAVHSQTYP